MKYLAIWLIVAIIAIVAIASYIRKQGFKATVDYIAKDEMPIWLSIVLAVSAGLGTYYLAPLINESFEFQKNRSTHLISTIGELNKSVIDLSVATRKYNDSLVYKRKNLEENRGNLLDKIAELQWRLVDANVIIRRVYKHDLSTTNLSKALAELQIAVDNSKKPEDQEVLADKHVLVDKAAEKCMITLYEAANIN